MSQPDLISQLREARPAAPAELRERVRLIAAEAPVEPKKPFNWRRAFVVAVPAFAASIAAIALLPSGGGKPTSVSAVPPVESTVQSPTPKSATGDALATSGGAAGLRAGTPTDAQSSIPTPSSRIQRISAALELRVPDTQAVSDNTKQAVQIARSLGGYPSALNVDASGKSGYATIVLRIPKPNVQKAVNRLSALGTIVGENVKIQDIQAQVDLTSLKIKRLNHALAVLKTQYQTNVVQNHIAALTSQIAHLKRNRTNTVHTASYATVSLDLTTRPAPVAKQHAQSPLHGLKVAFHWAWIGAVYALALGSPVIFFIVAGWWIARSMRRRGEERLLAAH